MTLNTSVLLFGDITGDQACELALGALLDAAGRGDERDTAQWKQYSPTNRCTVIGQGLPGIVDVNYNPDGGDCLYTTYEYDDDDNETEILNPCAAELSWDTAYGYREGGLTCTELHASALIYLYQSLPDGVTMRWQNEYSGKWWDGLDNDGLTDFLGGGDEAFAWFHNVVVPVMEAEAAVEGGTLHIEGS